MMPLSHPPTQLLVFIFWGRERSRDTKAAFTISGAPSSCCPLLSPVVPESKPRTQGVVRQKVYWAISWVPAVYFNNSLHMWPCFIRTLYYFLSPKYELSPPPHVHSLPAVRVTKSCHSCLSSLQAQALNLTFTSGTDSPTPEEAGLCGRTTSKSRGNTPTLGPSCLRQGQKQVTAQEALWEERRWAYKWQAAREVHTSHSWQHLCDPESPRKGL